MGTELPDGETIRIGIPEFRELELSTFNSTIVPVVVITREPERIVPVGTAFCIGSRGLWVTARHVLEGRGGAFDLQKRYGDSYIAILWVGSGVGQDVPELPGGVIPVRFMVRHPASGSDLALLGASRPNLEFPTIQLSARLPIETVPVLGLGYPNFIVRVDDKNVIHADNNIHASSGEVLRLYPNGRDAFVDLDGNFTGKLPAPCFETSARFDAGMSGGPVLDPNDSICGVIATGFQQGETDESGATSFVSAMPYIFMMKVPYDVYMTGEALGGRKMLVYEMVQRGLVSCDESFGYLKVTEADGKIHVDYDV
ncbi:S1 family peptidase [Mycolicibacterium pallens]|uniref:Serine protease n=1 Tax=Mycolicibacterium pallens TaxID=370524 RepID=A0ABX8VJM4_9MYCO|nr:serine protease [Mycolicibacterium pallens]QYL15741.1 serine protease [Mycolicibacterium pallens]